MRRYDPEWFPRTLPSDIPLVCADRVLFNVADHYLYIPGFLLFNGVSIFRSFLNSLNSFDMKAAIDAVNQTATSTKVFDVVFQPLLYGYLDFEEIENKSTVRQNSIAVLADGLVLADRIEATSVIVLIEEELHDRYASASLSVAAIKKLFRARPMTTDFLTHYMSRLSSIPRDTEILQSVREQVEGFAEFEQACRKKFDELRANAKEQVTILTINQEEDLKTNAEEPLQTPRIAMEDTDPAMDKEVDMQTIDQELLETPIVKMQVLAEEECTVKQGKRPLQDPSPAFPACKRHKEDDAISDTTAVPSTPRLAPTADSIVGLSASSAQSLKDLPAATPSPLSTIAERTSAAAAPKAAKGKAKAKTSNVRRETAKPRGKKQVAPAVELFDRKVPVDSDEVGRSHQAENTDFSHGNDSAEPSAAIVSTTASPLTGAARLTALVIPEALEAAMLRSKTENKAVSKSTAKPKKQIKSKTKKATCCTTPKATTQAKATIKTRTRAATGAASNLVPVLVSKTATPPKSNPNPKTVARTKPATKPKLTLNLGSAAEPEPATDAELEFEDQSPPQTEPTSKQESVPTAKAKANAHAYAHAAPKVAAPAPEPFPNTARAPSKALITPKRPATRSRKTTALHSEFPVIEDELPPPQGKAPANAVTTDAKPGAKRRRKHAASPPPPEVIISKTANSHNDGDGAAKGRKGTASDATISAVDNTARGAIHGAVFNMDAVAAGLEKAGKDTGKVAESKTGPDNPTPKASTRGTRKGLADRKRPVTAAVKAASEATPKVAVTQNAVAGASKASPKAPSAAKGKVKRNAGKAKTTTKKVAIIAATGDDEDEDRDEGEVETARPHHADAGKAGKYVC